MESLKFSDYENQAYNFWFSHCDVEKTGKISGTGKVSELFLSSGLPQETLHQISTVCGARQQGYFGRIQFYIACKLIAAAQNGLPVMVESINSGRELPLPKFLMQIHNEGGGGAAAASVHGMVYTDPQQQQQVSSSHILPPHIPQQPAMNMHLQQQQMIQLQMQQQQQMQQQLNQQELQRQQHMQQHMNQMQMQQALQMQQQQQHMHMKRSSSYEPPHSPPTFSPKHTPPMSPRHAATATTNHHKVVPPQQPATVITTVPGVRGVVPSAPSITMVTGTPQAVTAPPPAAAHFYPRQSQEWTSFENGEMQSLVASTSNDTAPVHVETKESWAHFSTDSSSKGADTSDMTSDSESLDEVWAINDEQKSYYTEQFRTMQPDTSDKISGSVAKEFFEKSKLPLQELSKIWELSDHDKDGALTLDEFCTAMHLVVLRRNDIELPNTLPLSLMPAYEPFACDLPQGSTLKRATPTSPSGQVWPQPQFTGESPTSSIVSSPGATKPTPVNFEFKPITADADPQIAHPVPLRMSPQGHMVADNSSKTRHTSIDSLGYDDLSPNDPPPKYSSVAEDNQPEQFTNDLVDLGPDSPPVSHVKPVPIQPKAIYRAGGDTAMAWPGQEKESAPAPPPRARGHSRSSSLDNQLDQITGQLQPPPVPRRPSPKDEGVVLATGDNDATSRLKSEPAPELDEETKKKIKECCEAAKKDLHAAIREQKEKNLTLARLNGELNQELQEVMEQRIALEIQMEHLKPFSYSP